MKNYATETDIIKIADPLFFPGDMVRTKTRPFLRTYVRDCAWDDLSKTWTYCLAGSAQTSSIDDENAPEKDLVLISRPRIK